MTESETRTVNLQAALGPAGIILGSIGFAVAFTAKLEQQTIPTVIPIGSMVALLLGITLMFKVHYNVE